MSLSRRPARGSARFWSFLAAALTAGLVGCESPPGDSGRSPGDRLPPAEAPPATDDAGERGGAPPGAALRERAPARSLARTHRVDRAA